MGIGRETILKLVLKYQFKIHFNQMLATELIEDISQTWKQKDGEEQK